MKIFHIYVRVDIVFHILEYRFSCGWNSILKFFMIHWTQGRLWSLDDNRDEEIFLLISIPCNLLKWDRLSHCDVSDGCDGFLLLWMSHCEKKLVEMFQCKKLMIYFCLSSIGSLYTLFVSNLSAHVETTVGCYGLLIAGGWDTINKIALIKNKIEFKSGIKNGLGLNLGLKMD